MDRHGAEDQAAQRAHTREAYDRLAPVWSSTTDDGPFNGWLERPALRWLVPMPLTGTRVLDAGCGSGAQCEWLSAQGADVVGVDLSPAMVAETRRRCDDRGTFVVADLCEPLALGPGSVDGITCSLVLHYLQDWRPAMRSFATVLRSGGWMEVSLHQGTVTQRFWKRPLSADLSDFADAGFVVERVVEAPPSAEARQRFPEALGPVVGVPWFIVYRLQLTAPV